MWFGWSSRVLLPEAKTDESLSKVSLPSGAGYCAARSVRISVVLGVALGARQSRGGNAPRVTVAALASAPPTKKPRPKAWRMLRTALRSDQT